MPSTRLHKIKSALIVAFQRRPRFETLLSICLVLATVAFALHASELLYQGRYSVTRQDYWRIYNLDLHFPFPINALYKHNDHPVFFPSLLWLPILHFFHNDQTILFFVGLAITWACAALLLVSLWRSPSLTLAERLTLGLFYTVACLWLGKASITASGGFSCMYSTTILGVLAALLCFDRLAEAESGSARARFFLGILLAGIITSFSAGTGLAVWPTLAILAIFYRLGWRITAGFGATGALSGAIFVLLPNDSKPEITAGLSHLFSEHQSSAVRYLELLGAPWIYFGRGWLLSRNIDERLYVGAAVMGAAGLCLAIFFVVQLSRSSRVPEPAETVAFGLMIFILGSLALIVAGRGALMSTSPNEALAPRYCYWSPFFWATLPVLAFYRWSQLRVFPAVPATAALLITTAALPSQLAIGHNYEKHRKDCEDAALRLVCGVEDEDSLQRLFSRSVFAARIIYPLSRTYRERGLDMFAWPGAKLMGQKLPDGGAARDGPEVVGSWQIDAMLPSTLSGAPAAHFSGWCATRKPYCAADCVLISQGSGRVVGVGWITNREYTFTSHPVVGFKGYIRNFSKTSQYECRAASGGELFGQKLQIEEPIITLMSLLSSASLAHTVLH